MADRVSAGIELAFDALTEQRLRDLWLRLEEAGVATLHTHTHRQHRPHLTVTATDWLDIAAVRDAVASLPAWTPLPLRLSYVGMFPEGVLWLGPVVTGPLLDLHREIHQALARAGIDTRPYYPPGRWTPHCTVSPDVTPEQLPIAVSMIGASLPVSGHVVALDLVRHTTEDAEYHPLA